MTALQRDSGGAVVARFVGGAVRDAILDRPIKDIDIATSLSPQQVTELLVAQGIKVVPTGIDHGTVTVVVDDVPFEVTTLRRDVETDGRHAVVAFTDDWREDAARRDFTMNAIYADATGAIFDPFGGAADAEVGHVRFIGDARARISEDALRILRFFRFQAWYGADNGRSAPDADGLAACKARARDLAILSVERVSHELLRLLAAPSPGPLLELMQDHGILPIVLPEAVNFARLNAVVEIEAALGCVDPIRRLGALLPDGADSVGERLKLPKRDQDRLADMIVSREDVAPSPDGDAFGRRLRAIFYGMGQTVFLDHVLLNWAGRGGNVRDKRWRSLWAAASAWQRPELPVQGRDILNLGVAPGPAVGAVLEKLEEWWISKDFKPSRGDLMARLSQLVVRHIR